MRKIFIAAFSFIAVASLHANAQKSLLHNGGFENELESWNAGNAKVSTFVRKSGAASLAIVSYVKGKWEGVDQKVNLPKNTKAISLTGFYKTDDIEQGKNTWNTAVIILEFTRGDKKLGDGTPLIEKTGTEDWIAFKKNLRVPDEATGFRLMIALSEASGTFFVDDIAAKVISIEDFEKESIPVKTN